MTDALVDLVGREVGRLGGGEVELHVRRSRGRQYDARDGGLDAIAYSDTLSLGVRVFRNGRMGFSYGFRDDSEEVRRMVEAALFCADASDPDPAYGLPGADRGGTGPAGAETGDCLYDASWERVDERVKSGFVSCLEAKTLSVDPRMKRVRSASLRETVVDERIWNSDGAEESQRLSHYVAHVEAVAEDGEEGQMGYGYGFARAFAGLDPAAIAAEGADRALRMLGARRLPSGRMPVVLENCAAAELLEVLAPSFLGSQVAKGKSMLAGRIGEAVASPLVRVVDDPLAPEGISSAAFDDEGVRSRRNFLIEEGVLKGYLTDVFWGRKLGAASTGSCRRHGPKAPPTVGVSNLAFAAGTGTLAEILKEMGSGVLITEFLGIHTADPVSGDFSVGAAGIRFEGGERKEPVRGFAVSGNILALLSRVVAVGCDFRWFGNVGSPSVAVSCLDVGGE